MHHVEFFVHVYIDVAVLSFLLLCTPITAQLVSHPSLSSLLPSFTLSSLSFILYFSQPAVSLHLLLSLSLSPSFGVSSFFHRWGAPSERGGVVSPLGSPQALLNI